MCCIATWMVVMSLTTGINASWDVTESDYIWIILGPMIGVILVSFDKKSKIHRKDRCNFLDEHDVFGEHCSGASDQIESNFNSRG